MPAIRHSTTSGPITRNYLLGMNQYVPSEGYPDLGTWDISRSNDAYVVKGSVARTQPVENTIVCELSSDTHQLQPHGNYSSNFMESPDKVGKKAKLVFTVQRPSSDPDFAADYDKSLVRLLAVQAAVAKADVDDRRNFIANKQIRLNYPLFEPKTEEEKEQENTKSPASSSNVDSHQDASSEQTTNNVSLRDDDDEDEDMEDDSKPSSKTGVLAESLYQVKPELEQIWRETEINYRNRYMPVFGVNKSLIPYNLFPRFLKAGTIIVVSFTLIHHAFMNETRSKYAYDSYTANVKEISILALCDEGPSKTPSTPKRKGKFVSQTPPSRSTLKLSADTFAPVKSPSALGKVRERSPDTVSMASTSAPLSAVAPSVSDDFIRALIPALVPSLIPALVPSIASAVQQSLMAASGGSTNTTVSNVVGAEPEPLQEEGGEIRTTSSPSASSTLTQRSDIETESGSHTGVDISESSESPATTSTMIITKPSDMDGNNTTKSITPDRRDTRRRR